MVTVQSLEVLSLKFLEFVLMDISIHTWITKLYKYIVLITPPLKNKGFEGNLALLEFFLEFSASWIN